MVWLIDDYGMKRWLSSRGWPHVAISQRVWKQRVAVPTGAVGQSEYVRLWDLLVLLGEAIGSDPRMPRRWGKRLDPSVVANDSDGPTPDEPVIARAGVADDGMPCLLVTFLDER